MEARCVSCGARPAALIPMERNVGMIVLRQQYRTDGPFCRNHAIANARRYLGLTLVLGWWGVISFLVNFKMVATDLVALRTAQALPAPTASVPTSSSTGVSAATAVGR
jgi:hypothetical protein